MGHDMFGRFVYKNHDEFGKPIMHSHNQFGYLIANIIIDNIPPCITIIDISNNRISSQPGKNRCTVTFKANEDLAAWELRAGGEGAGQGTLVESGGSLSAGTTVEAYIDYNELPYEAEWRINIYAKDLAGNWTPYDDSR